MRKAMSSVINAIAKNNGYSDKFDLLRDYGFMPTVLTPKHHKIEIVTLLYKHFRKK